MDVVTAVFVLEGTFGVLSADHHRRVPEAPRLDLPEAKEPYSNAPNSSRSNHCSLVSANPLSTTPTKSSARAARRKLGASPQPYTPGRLHARSDLGYQHPLETESFLPSSSSRADPTP